MHRPLFSCQKGLSGLRVCAAVCVSATLSAMPSAASAAEASARQLNDTGKVKCYQPDWAGKEIACAGTGQDGQFGRDVSEPQRHDGYAGFSYRKISSTGEVLPATATEWACVQDRVTGLMWEMKTADGGLHDGQRTYTHKNNDDPTDTGGFVNEVNQAGLCGYNDWRLPSRMELQSIVNYGHPEPMIVNSWFPNTAAWIYWTSTRDAERRGYWIVSFQYGVVLGGDIDLNQNSARLVRGKRFPSGEHAPGRYVADGDKVTDTSTGLVWRRCAEGTTWDGTTCVGDAPSMTWAAALALANAAHYDGVAWRLPNATELFSIVDDTREFPAINVDAFPGVAGMFLPLFWSGTPDLPDDFVGGITDVFDVDFDFGWLTKIEPTNKRAVRLVRVE